MEALPDIYPLTGLQIGDVQSYVSRAFLYLAPLSKKVFILVDNQPWRTSNQSRSARLWQFMVTKYRTSPFVNSRALRRQQDKDKDNDKQAAAGEGDEWFPALHGFLVFEVAWRDVHGINYLNELLTDTSLALEARRMSKWEFYSAEQAAGCTQAWFRGRAAEARALRGYLGALHAAPGEQCLEPRAARTCSWSDDDEDAAPDAPTTQGDAAPSWSLQYCDTLLLLRFRHSLLPLKLRQIVLSDIRLLTLLESGLPAWVIFLQSYPLLCQLYRSWMRPLARSLYLLASLATVLIGFYDLYKNVPLLRAAAARICGPLFGWIETWDMVSRIRYLGTILFLRNLRRCLQSLLALLRTARTLLRAVAAPLADACADLLLGPAWALLVDLAAAVWAPLDFLLDLLWPLLQVALLPARCAAALAGAAGSLLSATYNFGKDIWETVSSIFELNHMSEAQHAAFDTSQLKALWNDLFSQIFRAIRGILNGILVFFASCNRHRLSIYNHVQSRLRHMLRVAGLAPPSCRCKTKHRLGQNKQDDAVECDVCK